MQAAFRISVVRVCLVVALALSNSACFTMRAERPAAADAIHQSTSSDKTMGKSGVAHVMGDYHVRAGAPVNVFLRSVDDQALHFWQHAADIDPGLHRLLVDCSVVATQKLSRHELNVTLDAGVRYRLTAEANDQQGCTRVILEELE